MKDQNGRRKQSLQTTEIALRTQTESTLLEQEDKLCSEGDWTYAYPKRSCTLCQKRRKWKNFAWTIR